MAPESERAKLVCSVCGMGEQWNIHNLRLAENICGEYHEFKPIIPPTPLTCSEVVERLATECVRYAEIRVTYPFPAPSDYVHAAEFDREKATAILHSWRERRVQELEEALRLAGIRIGICAGRMRGCNEENREVNDIKEYHELVNEVDAWKSEAEQMLANSEWREQIRKGAKHE